MTGLDIGCAAAGQAAVDIRFAYRQNPIVGNGYSHYYWGIDDIRIEASPFLPTTSSSLHAHQRRRLLPLRVPR